MRIQVPDFSQQLSAVGNLSNWTPGAAAVRGIRQRASKARDALTVAAPKFRGANLAIQNYTGEPGQVGTVEFILHGPAETGKTWAALWRFDSLMRANPGEQGILARKIQSTLWGTVLVTWRRIQELRAALGEKPAKPYGGEKPEFYDYDNGARVWVGGMDNPQKILSGERGAIYLNQAEEFELKDWETLLTRCTGRGSKMKPPFLFGDANPGPEDHWILKRKEIQMFQSRHVDNPSLYDDDGNATEQGKRTIATLQSLTGIRRARLYEGKWVGAEGLFFEVWDEAVHTCEPFEIPADWPIWGALDYGFAHNTALGLFTEDNDGRIYMIGEHIQHRWLVPQHCRAIRRLYERCKIDPRRVRQIVAGHDCFQQRGSSDGKTIAEQYRDAKDPETGEPIGLRLEKATVDRITGATELLNRLGNPELNIKPRLVLFKTCPRTASTMTRMVCDPRDPEDVLKVDSDQNGNGGDDAYDMLRYGVMRRYRRLLGA